MKSVSQRNRNFVILTVKLDGSLEQMLKPYQCSISIKLKNMGHILIELSKLECCWEIVVSTSHDMFFFGFQ